MKASLLESILDPSRLTVVFQPIFHIRKQRNRVHSLEALIRGPRGTNFERADLLFDYVRRKKAEAAMDRGCLAAICKAAAGLSHQFRLNVNVHAATLAQTPRFTDFIRDLMRDHSLALDRLTIEIVEHTPPCNVSELMNSLMSLRDSGVRIALDDVGLGQSNYRMMLDCHPEYFKLDTYFVRGLRRDAKRRAVVQSVVTLAAALDSSVVAEGAESHEDIVLLASMGVEFAQTNTLCAPMSLEALQAIEILSGDLSSRETPLRDKSSSKVPYDETSQFAALAGSQ